MLNNNIFCIHIIYVMMYIYMIWSYIYIHYVCIIQNAQIPKKLPYILPTYSPLHISPLKVVVVSRLLSLPKWHGGNRKVAQHPKKAAAACDSLKSLWSLWTVETSDFRRFKNGLRGNTGFQYDLQVSTVNWQIEMIWCSERSTKCEYIFNWRICKKKYVICFQSHPSFKHLGAS